MLLAGALLAEVPHDIQVPRVEQGCGAPGARVLRVGALLAEVAHDIQVASETSVEHECGAPNVRMLIIGALLAEA